MRRFSTTKIKWLALLLLPTLAFGPVGCGPEVITMVAGATAFLGGLAFTFHQFQMIEEARLDIELKRLEIQGRLHDGNRDTVHETLSRSQIEELRRIGKVRINGRVLPVHVAY